MNFPFLAYKLITRRRQQKSSIGTTLLLCGGLTGATVAFLHYKARKSASATDAVEELTLLPQKLETVAPETSEPLISADATVSVSDHTPRTQKPVRAKKAASPALRDLPIAARAKQPQVSRSIIDSLTFSNSDQPYRKNADVPVLVPSAVESTELSKQTGGGDSLADHDFPTPAPSVHEADKSVVIDHNVAPETIQDGGAPGTKDGDKQRRGKTPAIMDQAEATPDFPQER